MDYLGWPAVTACCLVLGVICYKELSPEQLQPDGYGKLWCCECGLYSRVMSIRQPTFKCMQSTHNVCIPNGKVHATLHKCISIPPTRRLFDCVQQHNPFDCQSLTPKRHDDTHASCRETCTVQCRQKRRRFRHICCRILARNKAKCVIEIFRGIEPWKVRERDTHSCSF